MASKRVLQKENKENEEIEHKKSKTSDTNNNQQCSASENRAISPQSKKRPVRVPLSARHVNIENAPNRLRETQNQPQKASQSEENATNSSNKVVLTPGEEREKAKREACFKMIFEGMKNASVSGEFVVDGEAFELPTMIGLEVNGFGSVSLPLVDAQAKKLVKMCDKQHLQGDLPPKLIVYSYYELNPRQVQITNSEWKKKLKELVNRVGKRLGCQDEIEVS